MTSETVREIIYNLIQISQDKYGLIKVGKDTLNQDILFIEKYETLKRTLNIENIDQVDFSEFPEILQLKIMIEEINEIENSRQNKNMTLNRAIKAYKK